jgi:hypothetical protein
MANRAAKFGAFRVVIALNGSDRQRGAHNNDAQTAKAEFPALPALG